MAFTLPDDLSPEIYPLAWLIGSWRGYGILTYGESVPEQAVYQEMTFDHDGGPYVRQTTTIWTLDATRSENLDFEMPGLEGAERITPAQVWSTETTYWRPVGQETPDSDDADTRTPITTLELVSNDPAGHVAVWEGWIQGPRANVATQAVGRTRTSAEVTEMTRMFGLVHGDLMWTQDMAAFGEKEVKTYASGRLGRVEDPDDPANEPGAALRDAIAKDEALRSGVGAELGDGAKGEADDAESSEGTEEA